MTKTIAPIAALLLSVAFLLMGDGLQSTLLPVRASIEAYSAIEIGILGSTYFAGFVAGCVLGPRLVKRAGPIRTFAALSAVASAVALAHALETGALLWWHLRAATAFYFAGLYVVIESWLNERAENENHGFIMSLYTLINLGVIVIGQLMMTLADPAGFPLFLLASILLSVAAVPVALTAAPPPAPLADVQLRPRRLFRL